MVVDMLWNALSVSPRVITLALFASYEVHWFWYIAGTHIVVMMGASYFLYRGNDTGDAAHIIANILLSAMVGIGCLFNLCESGIEPTGFPVYLVYWIIMFAENTVMISLWYHWSNDLDLWYHDIVVTFVIVTYLLSLVVECLHAYFYNGRKSVCDIWEWLFDPGDIQGDHEENNTRLDLL